MRSLLAVALVFAAACHVDRHLYSLEHVSAPLPPNDGMAGTGGGPDAAVAEVDAPGSVEPTFEVDASADADASEAAEVLVSVCGDRIRTGDEQCDDGNDDTGDGCSPTCRLEPVCPPSGGACSSPCGDGLLTTDDHANGIRCDDGNSIDGDGCSRSCDIEPEFFCNDVLYQPDSLVLPIVLHDFRGVGQAGGHPDFNHFWLENSGAAGITQAVLGPARGGLPVHVAGCVGPTANHCNYAYPNPPWDPDVDWFGMWFVDTAAYNEPVVDMLRLEASPPGSGSYLFASSAFFPLDGKGLGNGPGDAHNYGFTAHLRTWFEYRGAESLEVQSDDDLWVFINGKLALDLGGTHEALSGSIGLNAQGSANVCDLVVPCPPGLGGAGRVVDLGLKIGGVYELAIFHAERSAPTSSLQLRLTGFSSARSQCTRVMP